MFNTNDSIWFIIPALTNRGSAIVSLLTFLHCTNIWGTSYSLFLEIISTLCPISARVESAMVYYTVHPEDIVTRPRRCVRERARIFYCPVFRRSAFSVGPDSRWTSCITDCIAFEIAANSFQSAVYFGLNILGSTTPDFMVLLFAGSVPQVLGAF